MFQRVNLAVLSVLFLAVIGCSSGPVSPQPPWTTVTGDFVWVEEANIDNVYNAVTRTMKDMNFSVINQQQDGLSGMVTAKTLQDELVTIELKAETASWTRVSIRVGKYLNDKNSAQVIYERIKLNIENKML